ncbi:DUF262 domain-containing protein [Moraxella sp. ZY200743]|uniref:DUF262 domain-containing protein n=1 Tax=Moraxella sp. ZY200743 TaxID=2911970 RepID=UPI003D7CDB11
MAELTVNKKSISELFTNTHFFIPDYQRPYEWDIENCETLWNDIIDFFNNQESDDDNYFLGTIVYYPNKKQSELIDGQQRTTSLMLLLRAFYKQLEEMQEDEQVIGLKNQLAPCLWDINKISQKVDDKSKIHIVSEVITEQDNLIFRDILENGIANQNNNDNYSKNYLFFQKKCNEFAQKSPMAWKELCITIISQCIILPIECDTQDTALTIFSTLNNRGLPLSDADIFKAQLYKKSKDRKDFTDTWKELTQICKQANISIDDVFRYYMHILRARDGNAGKEIGLRRFYTENKSTQLDKVNILEILELANFWKFIFQNYKDSGVNYKFSLNSKKWLNCFRHYPNDYWRYAVSVFFMKYKDDENFESLFEQMLENLLSFLFAKFIDKPTVNAIKDNIFKACVAFEKSTNHQYQYDFELHSDLFLQRISEHSSSRITRALLILHAYLNKNQKDLIDGNFDIEHIFPTKWQNTNYNGWNKNDADTYLNNIGNKIVLETKLNIQAGNGYFGKKKEKYSQSKITVIQELANYPKDDWLKEDITQREKQIKKDLIAFFDKHKH